jgi:hypothetical protein
MTNKTRSLIPAALLLASVTSLAQTQSNGVITINGGRNAIFVKTPTQLPAPPPVDPQLVTIYSNLGTGSHVYNAIAGLGILGKDAGQSFPQWSAFSFIPTADHTVTQIRVGASHVSGTNTMILSLNEDNNGIPGNPLQHWTFADLPTFGSCCALQIANSKHGIPVKKGTKYWVVLKTSNDTQDTYDVWNNDIRGEQGSYSNNLGFGWVDGGIQQQGAFGVFGQ